MKNFISKILDTISDFDWGIILWLLIGLVILYHLANAVLHYEPI